MKIRVDGQEYVGFEVAATSRHFLDVCGTYMFTTSPQTVAKYPLRCQQSCEVIVEDQIFVTGFIEKVNIIQSSQNVSISVEGRDKTCDLVDSTIDNAFVSQFDGTSTLQEVCQQALDVLDLSDIITKTLVPLKPLGKGTYVIPFVGERAFDFLQRYAKLSQVYLTTDGLGNLVITRSAYADNSTPLLADVLRVGSNVLEATYNVDSVHRYNLYRDYSQLSATSIESANQLGDTTEVRGQIIDSQIRKGRQWVFIDDIPVDEQTAQQRAVWEKNYRLAKSESYTCTVSGHTKSDGSIWEPNTLVQVVDDIVGFQSKILLIDCVSFYESITEGKTTTLNCVDPLCYTLQLTKNYYEAKADPSSLKYFDSSVL